MEKEIAQHDTDIAAWTAEKEEATYQREKEHEDFTASIDSVERAVETIKAGAHDVSLVQQKAVISDLVALPKVPEHSRRILQAFIQNPSHLQTDLMEMQGPGDAKAFESSS